jgi:transposase-like protein
MAATRRFFDKAMKANGDLDKVATDRRGANEAVIDAINNIVEQDHRAIKRVTRPMFNFKSFRCANCVLAGIGVIHMIHMIRKGQFADGAHAMPLAEQFSALAGRVCPK